MTADVDGSLSRNPSQGKGILVQKDWRLRLDGDTCMVRWRKTGQIEMIAACRTRSITAGKSSLVLVPDTEFIEIQVEDGKAKVVAGSKNHVKRIAL